MQSSKELGWAAAGGCAGGSSSSAGPRSRVPAVPSSSHEGSWVFRAQDGAEPCPTGAAPPCQPHPWLPSRTQIWPFLQKQDLYPVNSRSQHPLMCCQRGSPLWCPFSVRGAMYSLCVTSACLEELLILGTVCWLKLKLCELNHVCVRLNSEHVCSYVSRGCFLYSERCLQTPHS